MFKRKATVVFANTIFTISHVEKKDGPLDYLKKSNHYIMYMVNVPTSQRTSYDLWLDSEFSIENERDVLYLVFVGVQYARLGEFTSFENFCDEMGYSRKSKKSNDFFDYCLNLKNKIERVFPYKLSIAEDMLKFELGIA